MIKETELLTLPGKATAVSLELPPMDYDEWRVVLFRCVQLKHFAQFAIGDALNYGESHWGEMYAQAASETKLSEDTLTIFKYVSSRVQPLTRIKNWSACRQVAKLEQKDQIHWLERFEKEGWSVSDLIQNLTAAGLRNTRLVQREADRLAESLSDERESEREPDDETPPPAYEVPEVDCYYCGKNAGAIVLICKECENKLK